MKRTTKFICMLMATAIVTLFAACSDDDEKEELPTGNGSSHGFTVTLKAGDGLGDDIILNTTNDFFGDSEKGTEVSNGKFFTMDGELWIKFPDCPETFKSPDGKKIFKGWVREGDRLALTPGTYYPITSNLTLVAVWDAYEFVQKDLNQNEFKYRVTSYNPMEVEVTGCSDRENIVIPETVKDKEDKYTVVGIAEWAFQNSSRMKTMDIPASVRYIGERAFKGYINLTEVTLHSLPSMNPDLVFGSSKYQNVVRIVPPYIEAGGVYWATFYHKERKIDLVADENTKVYKASVGESTLQLHEVADGIIDDGDGVILKSVGQPVLRLTKQRPSDRQENDLEGVTVRTKCTDIKDWIHKPMYTLGVQDGVPGFYLYTEEYLPTNTAYFKNVPPANGAPGFTFE